MASGSFENPFAELNAAFTPLLRDLGFNIDALMPKFKEYIEATIATYKSKYPEATSYKPIYILPIFYAAFLNPKLHELITKINDSTIAINQEFFEYVQNFITCITVPTEDETDHILNLVTLIVCESSNERLKEINKKANHLRGLISEKKAGTISKEQEKLLDSLDQSCNSLNIATEYTLTESGTFFLPSPEDTIKLALTYTRSLLLEKEDSELIKILSRILNALNLEQIKSFLKNLFGHAEFNQTTLLSLINIPLEILRKKDAPPSDSLIILLNLILQKFPLSKLLAIEFQKSFFTSEGIPIAPISKIISGHLAFSDPIIELINYFFKDSSSQAFAFVYAHKLLEESKHLEITKILYIILKTSNTEEVKTFLKKLFKHDSFTPATLDPILPILFITLLESELSSLIISILSLIVEKFPHEELLAANIYKNLFSVPSLLEMLIKKAIPPHTMPGAPPPPTETIDAVLNLLEVLIKPCSDEQLEELISPEFIKSLFTPEYKAALTSYGNPLPNWLIKLLSFIMGKSSRENLETAEFFKNFIFSDTLNVTPLGINLTQALLHQENDLADSALSKIMIHSLEVLPSEAAKDFLLTTQMDPFHLDQLLRLYPRLISCFIEDKAPEVFTRAKSLSESDPKIDLTTLISDHIFRLEDKSSLARRTESSEETIESYKLREEWYQFAHNTENHPYQRIFALRLYNLFTQSRNRYELRTNMENLTCSHNDVLKYSFKKSKFLEAKEALNPYKSDGTRKNEAFKKLCKRTTAFIKDKSSRLFTPLGTATSAAGGAGAPTTPFMAEANRGSRSASPATETSGRTHDFRGFMEDTASEVSSIASALSPPHTGAGHP